MGEIHTGSDQGKNHRSTQQGRLAYVDGDPKPRHGHAGPLRREACRLVSMVNHIVGNC